MLVTSRSVNCLIDDSLPQVSSTLEDADLVAGMEDLKLTSEGGRPLTLTPEQLRSMTRDRLIAIWKDYVNQLAVLLVELERGDNPAAGDTIKQYIEEVVSICLSQGDSSSMPHAFVVSLVCAHVLSIRMRCFEDFTSRLATMRLIRSHVLTQVHPCSRRVNAGNESDR